MLPHFLPRASHSASPASGGSLASSRKYPSAGPGGMAVTSTRAGSVPVMAGDVAGAVQLVLQAVSRRSESSHFCIAFRPWDAAALGLGGRQAEAVADLAALDRVVG